MTKIQGGGVNRCPGIRDTNVGSGTANAAERRKAIIQKIDDVRKQIIEVSDAKELLAAKELLEGTLLEFSSKGINAIGIKLREVAEVFKKERETIRTENDSLINANGYLVAQNGELAAANGNLSAENRSLRAEIKSLKAENETLRTEKGDLRAENAELSQRLSKAASSVRTLVRKGRQVVIEAEYKRVS